MYFVDGGRHPRARARCIVKSYHQLKGYSGEPLNIEETFRTGLPNRNRRWRYGDHLRTGNENFQMMKKCYSLTEGDWENFFDEEIPVCEKYPEFDG